MLYFLHSGLDRNSLEGATNVAGVSEETPQNIMSSKP